MRGRFLCDCGLVRTAQAPPRRSIAARLGRHGEQQGDRWDSPQFRDGTFHSTEPTHIFGGLEWVPFCVAWSAHRIRPAPKLTIPVEKPRLGAAAELAVTWLGNASVLVEIDHHWILLDPIFGERPSPISQVGPKRTHASPVEVSGLPQLTAVVISHDHYDHLDAATVAAIVSLQDVPFVVPLGVGSHLRRWGVPNDRIIERDWGGEVRMGPLTLTCTEARHFSGRWLARNKTLWSSWVITSDDGPRVFFGGDSGYAAAFSSLGTSHGPFDITMVPIGAYDRRWPDMHMTPEEAIETHINLHGGTMLPIHWLTWDLAFHSWDDPIERAVIAAESRDVNIGLPRPGQRFDSDSVPTEKWWRTPPSDRARVGFSRTQGG